MLLNDFSFEDEHELSMFMTQLAATILFSCEHREPSSHTIPDANDPQGYDPIAQIMSRYIYWASHGYTNSLQNMVDMLYAYAHHLVATNPSGVGPTRRIVSDALQAYQNWKAALVASDDRGSQTYFALKDWADLNEQLLVGVVS